jgi:beta-hydroxylase
MPASLPDPVALAHALVAPRFLVVYVFLAAALFVHFRGRVRHSLYKQLTDHSTLMAPYNALMYLFSALPARPILDPRAIPELDVLRNNWRTIRDEAVALMEQGSIRAATGHNDLGFNSFFKNGWKRFYVKWYGAPMPSAAAACPKTVALVQSLPGVNAAMFALLPPGAKLNRHRDPFAGSLRYHLGLVTPNSERCRIYVDGQPYWWRDGEDLLFDETFIHSAANDTDVTRIILFCDVERPLRTPVMRALNRLFARHIMRAASTQNLETEPIGLLNRVYALFGHSSDFLTRLKRRNRTAFRAAKYALFVAAAYWIFVR